jgi:hypothetical protein
MTLRQHWTFRGCANRTTVPSATLGSFSTETRPFSGARHVRCAPKAEVESGNWHLPRRAFVGFLSVDVVARCVIQDPKPEPSIMRYELTDYEWTAIKPMLPNKPRGVPRVNDRRVLNGIFWVLRDLEHHGATCRMHSVLTPLVTIVSFAGVERACGPGL